MKAREMKLLALLLVTVALNGCAIAALPVAAQVPLWGVIATSSAAVGELTVDAVHACNTDPKCGRGWPW